MPARTGTREEWLAARRGMDGLWGMYQWLDRTPRGRNDTAGERVPAARRIRGRQPAGLCAGCSAPGRVNAHGRPTTSKPSLA